MVAFMARVAAAEQVHGVLGAADILVDRQPFVDRAAVGAVASGIGEAGEIPGQIDEGVHGVGFLFARRPATARAGHVLPGGMAVERIAGRSKSTSSGKMHRRSLAGTGTTPQAWQWMIQDRQPQ
jgi:hypothetical protein